MDGSLGVVVLLESLLEHNQVVVKTVSTILLGQSCFQLSIQECLVWGV